MTVSVAPIVKNEEWFLGHCLDSLRGTVDKIVVVDTGSEDATRAVAQRYTDRVYDFPGCQDFAAARQCAFDRATGDWVAWLDGDDVVHGAQHIKSQNTNAVPDVGVFYWRYIWERDAWGNLHGKFWRERCVRHDGTFRWSGRVHEVLLPLRLWTSVYSIEVVVEHCREARRSAENLRRNLDILEA
jgi:glycosyltransferase involved in cell wall biosynthesis